MQNDRPLSEAEVRQFERDGYLILQNVVDYTEAERFYTQAVVPALTAHNIDPTNPPTDRGGGAHVKGTNGHLIGGNDKRWPAFFDSPVLKGALNSLHGGRDRWGWKDGARDGVGWIHVRFPKADKWSPPSGGWHTDGDTHTLTSTQSVVVLPLVSAIQPGGGGTCMIRGSHRMMGEKLMRDALNNKAPSRQEHGKHLNKIVEENQHAIVEATGRAGDALLIHPFLVHAAGPACRGHPLRISFNLATRHRNYQYPCNTPDEVAHWMQQTSPSPILRCLMRIDDFERRGYGGLFGFQSVCSGKHLNLYNECSDDGAPVKIWGSSVGKGGKASRWCVVPVRGGGWYRIQSVCSGKFLTVAEKEDKNGHFQVVCRSVPPEEEGARRFLWTFIPEGCGGLVAIRHVASDRLLNVAGANRADGSKVIVWGATVEEGGHASRWRLTPA
uniref:Ricin B lectin domain-containing protein n=1 Tax=Chromera velia CCMP2878 TaxID=1169474 RepID=A0A0G4H8V2_9ALVE|eukprot:Cvel_5885.t1-p1 / transcript=Cvel_5885.t1 / gene=Cvel_5885 / organism=Chromera_velia_CCMP2878 / gene_product=hypothetical protein / transcript_product=hypothetical protein / location=Cvel_scaffold280:62719-64038(+) / protein_length=440 / sequence_SO=supercontig / SO=protein_coding / is_pseudo=false